MGSRPHDIFLASPKTTLRRCSMPRSFRYFFLLVFVLFGSGIVFAQQRGQPSIVVLRDSVSNIPAVAADHARRFGLSPNYLYQYAIKGYAAVIPPERMAALQSDPNVDFISDDRKVEAVGQALPTGIDRIDAERSTHFNSNAWSIAVAVIDTGSGPHADLNVVGGFNCSSGQSFNDGNGHGTHTAGTIGAI